MKYIVLIADGMEDLPIEELDGRTPLEVAKTPNIDKLAKDGRSGMVWTVPHGFEPASDVANLSIIGYDPKKYYSGRGPLEAANMGIDLKQDEVAFRCNLVTVDDSDTMEDYSAGHVPSKEAEIIINDLNQKIGSDDVKLYPGITYRHLMVVKAGSSKINSSVEDLLKIKCTPPHNIMGQDIKKYLPCGNGSDVLISLMQQSRSILDEHEINKVRIDLGENPANMIWLWGQGTKPKMEKFIDKYNVKGAIISAVNLINGMGKIIGLEVINVPGATGYYDTNYEGKAEYGMNALADNDFIYIHVEAADEAGHNGDLREKIKAIENFDKYIVGGVLKRCSEFDEYRILVLADHKTPVKLRKHTQDPIGFVLYGNGITPDEIQVFNEKTYVDTNLKIKQGHELMDLFINNKKGE